MRPFKKKATNSSGAPYFVYGVHAVTAVLKHEPHRAKKLILARSKEADELSHLAVLAGIVCEPMERSFLEKKFQVGSDAQGVVLMAAPFAYTPLNDLLSQKITTLLVLDSWQDGANLGRAARAALAFGAGGMIICKDRAIQVNSHAEKAAVGALSKIPVSQVVNLSDALQKLKEHNFFVYGADMDGRVALKDCDFAEKAAIVIGQEGSGLRELTKKRCDLIVNIPMAEPEICLNAADSALLFLYQRSQKK